MLNDNDYFIDCIDGFVKNENDPIKSELWKDYSIIELMHILDEEHNPLFVKNALIVIIALFEDFLYDSFHHRSKDVAQISESKKELFIKLLKRELS